MAWTKKGKFLEALDAMDINVIRSMIEGDASLVDLNPNSSSSPLYIAAKRVDLSLAHLLFSKGAKQDSCPSMLSSLLHCRKDAKQEDVENFATFLIGKGYVIDHDCFYNVILAQRYELVPFLLKNASQEKGIPNDLVGRLIEKRVDEGLIIKIIDAGAPIVKKPGMGSNGCGTLLCDAVKAKMPKLAHALLDRGYDINERDSNKNTPLHLAVDTDSVGLVEAFIERGAKLNVMNFYDKSPLVSARYYGRSPTIINLLEEAEKREARAIKSQKTDKSEEYWYKCGADHIAYVGEFTQIGRKVTEIFNFAARERVVIIENTAEKKETVSTPQSFNTIDQKRLRQAFDAFRAQGGIVEVDQVFATKRPASGLTIVNCEEQPVTASVPAASARPAAV